MCEREGGRESARERESEREREREAASAALFPLAQLRGKKKVHVCEREG